jgi:uncharacterized membrane protein
MQGRGWFPGSVLQPAVVRTVGTFVAVAAGAAIVEAAVIPGLLIGGAAVLAPRLVSRRMSRDPGNGRRRTTPLPVQAAPPAHSAEAPASGEPAVFDAWQAVRKTLTYRVMVTTVDFGANYFVIGELAAAASLSSLSLVAGPIAYFAHEAAWHYYGPHSTRHPNSLEAAVRVPIPGAARRDKIGRAGFANVKVSRAFAKTVTYEGVTAVSEFSVNYLFVRDLAAAAGLTAFSIAISPVVYYLHEKAWDYFDVPKTRARAPTPKLSPAA